MTIFDSIGDEPRPDGPWYGRIVAAPSGLSDTVEVTLPSFSGEHAWGPCRWQSRDDTSLPAAGDECLVMFDERRQPWVIAWWPFS